MQSDLLDGEQLTESLSGLGAGECGMRKRLVGIVTGDKTAKTRRVEVQRVTRHPKYGKIVRSRTICYAHDENNESRSGDTVEIVESRPLSALKRWSLVKIVQQGLRKGDAAGATEAEAPAS